MSIHSQSTDGFASGSVFVGGVRMSASCVMMSIAIVLVVSCRGHQGMLAVQVVRKRIGSTWCLIMMQIPRPWVRMCGRAAQIDSLQTCGVVSSW